MTTPLPNDVILIIISYLDIDTFLDFRLTCHKHHGLIHSHITGLSEAVARNTFPGQTLIFVEGQNEEDDKIQWLKSLRYHQLAAIIVEQEAPYSYRAQAMAANDPSGRFPRNALVCGWRTFAGLASIQHDTMLKCSAALDEELSLCCTQCDYILTLSNNQIRHLSTLLRLLQKYVIGEPGPREKRDVDTIIWHSILALLLQHGPELFWRSWWINRSSSEADRFLVKHVLETAWKGSTAQHLQRMGAKVKVLLTIVATMRKFRAREERKDHGDPYAGWPLRTYENPEGAHACIEFSTRTVQLRQLLDGIERNKVLDNAHGSVEWDDLEDEYVLRISKMMEALGPEWSGLPDHRNLLYGRPWPGVDAVAGRRVRGGEGHEVR